VNIFKKRGIAERVIVGSVNVVKERKSTESAVGVSVVKGKRLGTDRRVLAASHVENQRYNANCGI